MEKNNKLVTNKIAIVNKSKKNNFEIGFNLCMKELPGTYANNNRLLSKTLFFDANSYETPLIFSLILFKQIIGPKVLCLLK